MAAMEKEAALPGGKGGVTERSGAQKKPQGWRPELHGEAG